MDYKSVIAKNISLITKLPEDQVQKLIETPPQKELGDYAFPCFSLAKAYRKAPALIASDLSSEESLAEDGMFTVKNAGPYLNFYIDRASYAADTIELISKAGTNCGASDIGEGQNVIIEFSSPNIAKPFHVGHAFTTILGNSLSRIYDRLGYHVIRMNHLGDYGTQFGKLITAYRLWGDEEALDKDPINELLRIYVKFHAMAKEDPSLEDQARENFRKLEEGSSDEKALWQRFRDLSLEVFEKLYDRMGVKFDNYNGESFYSDRIPSVVDMLKEKNLLEKSDGAMVVKLDEYDLPPCIILKSDGTTIYASRDLAAVLYRKQTYNFDKNIYVVGTPQALHFKQVFSVLKKAGYDFADNCVHVGFGLVKFKDMIFSTREGNIILLEELLDAAVKKTREVIVQNAKDRGSDMTDDEINEIAEKVGIGSVIYTYVKSGREKDIVFSWEEMLNFNGNSAPYLMYTYARIRSILRNAEKSGIKPSHDRAVTGTLISDEAYDVISSLASFGDDVLKAASSYEPFVISRSLFRTASAFNSFYNNTRILGDDIALEDKEARLALCEAVSYVIKTGLYLLGIETVERM